MQSVGRLLSIYKGSRIMYVMSIGICRSQLKAHELGLDEHRALSLRPPRHELVLRQGLVPALLLASKVPINVALLHEVDRAFADDRHAEELALGGSLDHGGVDDVHVLLERYAQLLVLFLTLILCLFLVLGIVPVVLLHEVGVLLSEHAAHRALVLAAILLVRLDQSPVLVLHELFGNEADDSRRRRGDDDD